MEINVPDNPNCEGVGQVVFNESGPAEPIDGIIATGPKGGDVTCDITGVDADGEFIQAHARRVNDSGEGTCYLIYGGAWGIRLRPKDKPGPWDLKDTAQWGEAYKVYGSSEDILWRV